MKIKSSINYITTFAVAVSAFVLSAATSFAATEYLSVQSTRNYGPSRTVKLAGGQTINKDASGYVIGGAYLAANSIIQTLQYGLTNSAQLQTNSYATFGNGYLTYGSLSQYLQSLNYGNGRTVILNTYSAVSFTDSGDANGRVTGGSTLSSANQSLYYGPFSSTIFSGSTAVSFILGQIQLGTINATQSLQKADGTYKVYTSGTAIQFNSAGKVVSPL